MYASRRGGWWLLIGILLLVLLVLWIWMGSFGMMGGFTRGFNRNFNRNFDSNGERIYFTTTSAQNTPISFDMHDDRFLGAMPLMGGGAMACVDCHGVDGRGRRVRMMMTAFTAPDIRWETLSSADHGEAGAEDEHNGEGDLMEHPPYTEETLKRAITQGIDPAGEPLQWPMPRWFMSDEDLDDLVAYLKTLE